MTDLMCSVCRKKITKSYLQANINSELKSTDSGEVVCSEKCADKYRGDLKYEGAVMQHWSRITGYYQNVSGWNKGKVAELHDRRRFDI
ncbi:MAG: hypothetical protein CVT90_00025 [Candidatus Altiarchaeales archaeon HGW-Altiarchaeales-3]|nr:MAG: hypothetical protein CVT90_00025 [Candidatus Altiarchaeales archaeon HGW-Altiarchaeales-3]